MKTTCQEINSAINFANDSDNRILKTAEGWSEMLEVFYMNQPLTSALEEKIKLEIPSLKYWEYKGSPHNKADKGFFCEEHKMAISFPFDEKSTT